jgi:NTP pyrophosphatase (non-canonical NTP hydrolase)
MSYSQLELDIIRWAEARRIIPNSTTERQLLKTVEELGELISATVKGKKEEQIDAFGDVLVTLIIAADLSGINLVTALEHAWNQIKDRKGYLRPDGIFVREE